MYNIKMCPNVVTVAAVVVVGFHISSVKTYVINMLLVFMNFFVASKDMKYYLQKQWSVLQLVCYLQHWLF